MHSNTTASKRRCRSWLAGAGMSQGGAGSFVAQVDVGEEGKARRHSQHGPRSPPGAPALRVRGGCAARVRVDVT